MPEFTVPVEQDEYEASGSKFITFDSSDPVGKTYKKPVEIGVVDWDTPGVSMKFPVTIIGNDIDAGKTDKLSAGVGTNAVWKLKDTLKAIGAPVEMKQGAGGKMFPVFKSEDCEGKKAMGVWEVQMGNKGGDPQAERIKYPKLVAFEPMTAKS